MEKRRRDEEERIKKEEEDKRRLEEEERKRKEKKESRKTWRFSIKNKDIDFDNKVEQLQELKDNKILELNLNIKSDNIKKEKLEILKTEKVKKVNEKLEEENKKKEEDLKKEEEEKAKDNAEEQPKTEA